MKAIAIHREESRPRVIDEKTIKTAVEFHAHEKR